MTTHSFSQKKFTPVPPAKGSFPLDHEGECKAIMIEYMRCLHQNKHENTMCREVAKDYLSCRMDHNLMAKEDWGSLGFAEDKKET